MKNLFFSLKNENKKKIDTKKHYSNKTNEILFNDLFNNLKINECKKIETHSGKKNNNFDSNNKTIITNTINNVSKNVNTFPIPTTQKIGNKKNISKHNNNKSSHNPIEVYTQNKEIFKNIDQRPPNAPSLYKYECDLSSDLVLDKKGENYGTINKGKVPISFYNHLITGKEQKISNYKNKYLKTSITHRNKNKILTIVYYSRKKK